MKNKIVTGFVVLVAAILGIFLGYKEVAAQKGYPTIISLHHPTEDKESDNGTPTKDVESGENSSIPEKSESTSKTMKDIRAIYATGWSIGTKNVRESIISNMKENGFNAIVVDIKDENGQLSYDSNVDTAIQIGASKKMIANINNVINEFHENGIYIIGRIVTFKDPILAGDPNTVVAYRTNEGKTWKDYNGDFWPNPYNKNSWEYPIELAVEAAKLGFDEIQFDYIKFPLTEGKVSQIAYGFDSDKKSKADIICDFLIEAKNKLSESNVYISACVQGNTTKKEGDFLDIGQDFRRIAEIVDYICPTFYPSDYSEGSYGFAKPDLNPHDIVNNATKDAVKLVSNKDKIRPYLQDFTATWLGTGNYIEYNTNEVQKQIEAVFENNLSSFALWDHTNKYCLDALKNAQK